MKKHSSKAPQNIAAELITTVGVAALLSIITYMVVAFVWANVASFDAEAQVSVVMLSGIVFGLASGYRLHDIIGR